MDMKPKTVCFTGHRQIEKSALPILARRLETVLRQLIGEGCRYFGAGGALGFDYEKRKVMRSEVLDAA